MQGQKVAAGVVLAVGLVALGVLVGTWAPWDAEPEPAAVAAVAVAAPAAVDPPLPAGGVADVFRSAADRQLETALQTGRNLAGAGVELDRYRVAISGGAGVAAGGDCRDAIQIGADVPSGSLRTWPAPLLERAHRALQACAVSGGFGGGGVLAETAAAVAAEIQRRGGR